jgi:hypothetical protein
MCKLFRSPPSDEWINKLWYRHTIYYLAIKRNDALVHVTIGMNLENILSE